MAFDGVTVAALVKEFNTTLKDGRIYKKASSRFWELSGNSEVRLLLCG